jgi:hypothetical protein
MAVLLVQNECQQYLVKADLTIVVFDEAKFSKFIHEEIHAGARCADHFRQSFLNFTRCSFRCSVEKIQTPEIFDLPVACCGGKFVVSEAGEVYDARARSPTGRFWQETWK